MVKSFTTAQVKAKQEPENPEGTQNPIQNKAVAKAPANKVTVAPVVEDNETPADKFKRLANQRVNKALKYIDLTKNLANRQYEYTDEQVAVIIGALRGEIDELEAAFKKAAKVRPTIDLLSGVEGNV